MGGEENKVPCAMWLRQKLCTATTIIAGATKLAPRANRIVTVFGIFGIVMFFLAQCFGVHTIYRVVKALRPQKSGTVTYQYRKLQFDYVCTRHSAANATFTTHCTSGTRRGGLQLTTLSCDVSSVLLDEFLLLQNDGKCVVTKTKVANETGVDLDAQELNSQRDRLWDIFASFAIILLPFGLICYGFVILATVGSFTLYRHWICASPPLSANGRRGRVLTPKWRTYFLWAVVFSCSLLAFHGRVFFKLTARSFESALTSLFLGSVTALSPLLPFGYSFLLANETFSADSRPDTEFEGDTI